MFSTVVFTKSMQVTSIIIADESCSQASVTMNVHSRYDAILLT